MHVTLRKTQTGFLPGDPATEEWYKKVKPGAFIHGDFKQIRNKLFHSKYFALLTIGFENWEPGEIDSDYGIPMKNFDRFRKDVAILCGFYEIVPRLDGTARPEAKSISFANMDETEFQDLYSKTIDLFIKKIYGKDMTVKTMDDTVNHYLSFA